MQEELSVFIDQLCSSESCSFPERPFHGFHEEPDLYASFQCINTEQAFCLFLVPHDGIVSVPHEAQLRRAEYQDDRLGLFAFRLLFLLLFEFLRVPLLIRPDTLICCHYSLYDALGHLGRKMKYVSYIFVTHTAYRILIDGDLFCGYTSRNIRTRIRISPHGFMEQLMILIIRQDPDLSSQDLLQ